MSYWSENQAFQINPCFLSGKIVIQLTFTPHLYKNAAISSTEGILFECILEKTKRSFKKI